MNILAVSDEVLGSHYSADVKMRFPQLDLILGCGDLPYYYLDFLVSALDTPMYYVLGNHDGERQYTESRGEVNTVRGGLNLHKRSIHFNNFLIAGIEGSLRYRPSHRHTYSEAEMRLELMQLFLPLLWNKARFGRFLDILITHAPPFGIHDQDDLPHRGFRAFLPFLRFFRPRYLLHGHIHLYRHDAVRRTQYHHTTVINIYPSYLLQLEPVVTK